MELLLLGVLLLIFLGLPLLTMRKQSRRIKEIQAFQSTLRPGMVVKLTSGLHGRVSYVGETTVDLEVSPGVVTTWDKSAVLSLVDTVDENSGIGGQLTANHGDTTGQPHTDSHGQANNGVHGHPDTGDDLPGNPSR